MKSFGLAISDVMLMQIMFKRADLTFFSKWCYKFKVIIVT